MVYTRKTMTKLYTKKGCGQCVATKRFFETNEIEYKEIYVDSGTEEGNEGLARVKELGYLAAPVVETDGQHWSGFQYDKLQTLV